MKSEIPDSSTPITTQQKTVSEVRNQIQTVSTLSKSSHSVMRKIKMRKGALFPTDEEIKKLHETDENVDM